MFRFKSAYNNHKTCLEGQVQVKAAIICKVASCDLGNNIQRNFFIHVEKIHKII